MALATNLVAYYPFESNGNDSVGSNNLTNTGCTFTTGKIGNGATFGTKLISSTSPITGSSDWTVSIWAKTSVTGSNQMIFQMGDSAQTNDKLTGFYFTSANIIQLFTAGANITSASNNIGDGNYHHIVVKKATNSFTIYVDGVIAGTGTKSGQNLGTDLLNVGYDNPNSRWSWGGQLDEGSIHSRALSDDEVLQMFNSGRANAYPLTDTPSLYGSNAAWSLDESSGNAIDATGRGNTLTNNNTVSYTTGLINNCADFGSSNTNKYLSISNALVDTSTTGISSVAGWINLSTLPSSGNGYEMFGAAKNGGRQFEYKFENNGGTHRINFVVYDGGGVSTHQFALAGNWSTGAWHQVVFTINGNAVECYVDAVSRGTATITATGNTVATNSFRIANHPTVNADLMSGKADIFETFTRVISSTEVTTLYKAGTGLQYPWPSSTNITVNPSVQSITFSVPSYTTTTTRSITVSPTVQSITFSVPSYTASTSVSVSPAVQSITFSVPTYTVVADGSTVVSPSVQSITFSIPTYTIDTVSNITISPSVQAITFSLPVYTITTVANITVSPTVFTITFSIPTYTVLGDYWEEKFSNPSTSWSDKNPTVATSWNNKY